MATDTAGTTRVAYIVGTGRSGSTLLARMLGEVDGWFAAGELRYLFERGLVEARACSCGNPLIECPVWSAVLEEAYGSPTAVPVEHALRLLQATTRVRSLPVLARDQLSGRPSPELLELRDLLAPLYEAIRTVTGAQVIVDSSKLPSYLAVLSGVSSLDVRTVHLVRDPRAAAFSWQRSKQLTDGAARSNMEQIPPAKSALLWLGWNALTDLTGRRDPARYLRCRYEDLIADPDHEVGRILAMAGDGGDSLDFLPDGRIDLGVGHLVAGNPDRMRRGPTALRADDEWRRSMPRADRVLVGAATLPLRVRYGYLRARERSR